VNATNALRLMVEISKHAPALCKPHIGELCKIIAPANDKGKGKSGEGTQAQVVETAVMALANVVKWDEKLGSMVEK
jgi:sister-chromatid-cohesion protein PDS5